MDPSSGAETKWGTEGGGGRSVASFFDVLTPLSPAFSFSVSGSPGVGSCVHGSRTLFVFPSLALDQAMQFAAPLCPDLTLSHSEAEAGNA